MKLSGMLRPINMNDPNTIGLSDSIKAYPSDIGAIFPVLLNLVCLQPGQALFLKQGELHAYLSGVGIELMANSDNVLRGGLTSKHVDVAELMRILSFKEKRVDILLPGNRERHAGVYRTPAQGVRTFGHYPGHRG